MNAQEAHAIASAATFETMAEVYVEDIKQQIARDARLNRYVTIYKADLIRPIVSAIIATLEKEGFRVTTGINFKEEFEGWCIFVRWGKA